LLVGPREARAGIVWPDGCPSALEARERPSGATRGGWRCPRAQGDRMGYNDRAGRDAGEERPTMTDRVPIFVELCAGTAALSLRLEHPRARPPVSRMGAKTGYADVILRCMGLRPGQGADRYLWCEPDAGVRLLLHAYRDRELATAAADIIRGWADEEPRALWERLRAEGPAQCPPVDAREVARWATLQRWMYGNAPIGHDGEKWTNGQGGQGGVTFGANNFGTTETTATGLDKAPTLPATIADDARKVDPREVARWSWLQHQNMRRRPVVNRNGEIWCVANTPEAAGGMFQRPQLRECHDPQEIAQTIDGCAFCAGTGWAYSEDELCPECLGSCVPLPTLPATIANDARAIDPPQLPPGVVVYIDPPYLNTTGYAHAFPRSEWVPIVRRWKEAGAMVVVSEAEPIPELMADGWHAVRIDGERRGQKRTFSKQQAEWLTMSEAPRWRPSVQMGLWR